MRERHDGWKEEGVAEGETERSGTDREGGVAFVVGATKGGTENWRV